tara:strand:- start:71 stop:541 length:471 start_codon:yes stop_codon:yes gene_type:complete
MQSQALSDAYGALLSRAPSPLFARARQLYLNKYCLDGRNTQSPLRLFVVQEALYEQVEADQEAGPLGKVVTLQSSTAELALVHWQRDEPPGQKLIETYLQQSWQLQPSQLSPVEEQWFRNGGYQLRMTLQEPLAWVRSSRYQDIDNQSGKGKPTKS